jgi:hypothetical protein
MKLPALLATVSVLSVAVLVSGEDAKPKSGKPLKIASPFNKVDDLTDAQKSELGSIHKEIQDKIKALREEEEQRSWSVLTAEQSTALRATMETEKAEKKLRDAEKKGKDKDKADGKQD